MNNTSKFIAAFLSAVLMAGLAPVSAFAAQSAITTKTATSVGSTTATLNADLQNISDVGVTTVWFEWGTNTNYGSQTPFLNVTENGSIDQGLTGLAANTTYHYRAVVQDRLGISYGQDMTLTTTTATVSATLSVSKKVINLTQNNLIWVNSVSAMPSDVLTFAITLQAGSKDVHNIVVKDTLPSGLVYNGNLLVNAVINETSNPTSANGISIGTLPANEITIISYQVKVAPSASLPLGKTTLTNIATVTSSEVASQTVTSITAVENMGEPVIAGPTDYPTGTTNNFLTDSFLLPLLMIIGGSYLYSTRKMDKLLGWMRARV